MPKGNIPVINPNLGLYLDRPSIAVPPGALQDGLNFRIQQGRINNLNLGWAAFASFTLNGAVTLVATLNLRSGQSFLIFGTPTDLYKYATSGGGSVTYLTPTYTTGTISASGSTVTGTGTLWNTGAPTNAKAGDEINFVSNAQNLPGATWFTIQSVNSDTSLTLTSPVGTVAGGNPYTIRKKYTATAANPWTYDVFVNAQPASEDRIYFTNGVDVPVRWNGSDATVTNLNSLGFTCQTLAVYKNTLCAANLVQGGTSKPTDMVNSDVASPEVFGSGLANQFKLSGLTDKIVRLARLGDYLVIYFQRTVLVASFVGAPLVFTFRVVSDGKGLASTRGVAMYPSYHEFIGADTLYVFDGSSVRPISNHIWREAIRTEDPARANLVFTVIDESRGDYIWSVPLTSDPGAGTATSPPVIAYVEHYLETQNEAGYQLIGATRPHSRRSFPFTSAGSYLRQTTLTWDQLTNAWNTYNFKWNDQFFAASFPLSIVGDVNGKVWILNGAQDASGVALPSFVKFGRRAVLDGKIQGLLTRIYPFIDQFSTPLTVTANLTNFAMGPATVVVGASYDQTLPEGGDFVPIYRTGKYVDVQFGTAGPGQPWQLSGYDIAALPGSSR